MRYPAEMDALDRTSLCQAFVGRFRPATSGCGVMAVTSADINAAEAAIGGTLPTSYRTFVTQFGAGENDLPDDAMLAMAEIWQPEWIVRQVRDECWARIPDFLNGGVSIASDMAWKYLTPFGSESAHGYWFCFRRESALLDDAPVYHFNHGGAAIEQVADGFDHLVQGLLADDQSDV
jgi:hypothetical protein